MKKKFLAMTMTVLIVVCALSGIVGARDYRYFDMHLHYYGFVQETKGFDVLFQKMDTQNVKKAVVFGMAYTVEQTDRSLPDATYYLDDDSRVYWESATDYTLMNEYLNLSPERQKQIYPFICALNVNDKRAINHLKRLVEQYPGKWKGIGELLLRHDYLSWKAQGDTPTPLSPGMGAILDYAAEKNLLVLIHQDIAGRRASKPVYATEMEQVLKAHPNTRIIWAHVGYTYDIEVPGLAKLADNLLTQYPNLYFDISWVVFDNVIMKDKASMQEWAALITKHKTRFVIGTDKIGNFDSYNIIRYGAFLDLLDKDTADLVAYRNIDDQLQRSGEMR